MITCGGRNEWKRIPLYAGSLGADKVLELGTGYIGVFGESS